MEHGARQQVFVADKQNKRLEPAVQSLVPQAQLSELAELPSVIEHGARHPLDPIQAEVAVHPTILEDNPSQSASMQEETPVHFAVIPSPRSRMSMHEDVAAQLTSAMPELCTVQSEPLLGNPKFN